ncbi:unconventional myosin-Va isoform X2 [Aphis craccivora]|uniref:Unconventional myosin-Va isoform X2 n=1 Tax=Aphis craccivora TaxID=307492 RepID=A0A6G0Z705_APHCR|nr:unconventional myosin-Va isoform X2 [Aphis craccivora]
MFLEIHSQLLSFLLFLKIKYVNVLRNGKNSMLRTIFLVESSKDRKLSVSDRKANTHSKISHNWCNFISNADAY